MSLATLDIALRGASVALLFVLAATLLRDFKGAVGGRLAIAFMLGSAAHAATCGFGRTPISAWHAPLIALSTGNVVVFWLFTRVLFDDAFKLRWWHGLIWAAVVAFSFVNCLFAPIAMMRSSFATGDVTAVASAARISIIAVNLLALGFITLAVVQTVRSWSVDLVEGRRRLRL